jgi:hypothetical protein
VALSDDPADRAASRSGRRLDRHRQPAVAALHAQNVQPVEGTASGTFNDPNYDLAMYMLLKDVKRTLRDGGLL